MRLGVSYYYVGDISEAVQIYSGFLEIEPVIHEPDWARYDLDGGSLALHLNQALPRVETDVPVRHGAIVSFTVPDILLALTRAKQLGFRQPVEVLFQPYGKLAEIRDPWGNRIALFEPVET